MVDEHAHLAQVNRHIAAAKTARSKARGADRTTRCESYKIDEAENFLSALLGTFSAFECELQEMLCERPSSLVFRSLASACYAEQGFLLCLFSSRPQTSEMGVVSLHSASVPHTIQMRSHDDVCQWRK
jgi:hypothetical protein